MLCDIGIAIDCQPGCGTTNFEIKLLFLIKPFFTWLKCQRKNSNILRIKRTFKVKKEVFFTIYKGLQLPKVVSDLRVWLKTLFFQFLMSCLKVREQNKKMIFAQIFILNKEHLIFGMINVCKLHLFFRNIVSHQNSLDNSQQKACIAAWGKLWYCFINWKPIHFFQIFALYPKSVIQFSEKSYAFILGSF